MNCPHCNSTYVDVKYVYEDMDKKESKCKCSACNKDFVDVEAKELVKDGVPLLELRDNVDGYSGHSNTDRKSVV